MNLREPDKPCRVSLPAMAEPFQGFEIGKRFHLHRNIWEKSPGFGINIGGIAPKGRYPRTEAVYILATVGEDTRYGNRWDGDVLVYSGEDVKSGPERYVIDQDPEKGGNRVLTHSRELGIPLYCFWAKPGEEEWTYLGLGEVDSYSLVERSGRMVVEYRISFLGVPNLAAATARREEADTEVGGHESPKLTEAGRREREGASRRVRSQAFSRLVKAAYSERCAVCGVARKDAQGRHEVQAAHIYPVELNGRDDARNGLALCRLHHWAFDGALLGIETDLVIRVLDMGRGVPGVDEFDGKILAVVPVNVDRRPHELYLKERLALSKRSWTRGGEGDA
jgi:putative restriction endonuclease